MSWVRRRGRAAWIASLAALAFLPYLGSRDISASHEARVAQTAREMAASGTPWSASPTAVAPVVPRRRLGFIFVEPDHDAPQIFVNPWLVPILKGEIRLQKPPLPYWCAAICFRLFGFSEEAARLAPALLGLASVLFLHNLARLLLGARRAWLVALLWISTPFIPDEYRKAMADPYLAFFTLVCVWAWIKQSLSKPEHQDGVSPRSTRREPAGLLIVFYLALALGLLAKGPPLFVHIAAGLTLFHYCYRRRLPGTIAGHVPGILLALLVALPWPLYVWRHVPNALEVWRYESVGKLSDTVANARPWWFYVANLPLIALPWIVIWTAGWIGVLSARKIILAQLPGQGGVAAGGNSSPEDRSRPPRRAGLFPALWWLATVLFFSLVHLKKNPYLLPGMPAQILLMGQGLGAMLAAARRRRFECGAAIGIGAQAVLGIAVASALPWFAIRRSHAPMMASLMSLAALFAAVYAWIASRKDPWRLWPAAQTLAYVLLALLYSRFIITPRENDRSARKVAIELMAEAARPGHTLLMEKLPEEVAVYLPVDQHFNPSAPHVLVVRDDQVGVMRRERGKAGPYREPDAADFLGWFPDARVLFIDRVAMKSAPGDARWKVYELTIERKYFASADP